MGATAKSVLAIDIFCQIRQTMGDQFDIRAVALDEQAVPYCVGSVTIGYALQVVARDAFVFVSHVGYFKLI